MKEAHKFWNLNEQFHNRKKTSELVNVDEVCENEEVEDGDLDDYGQLENSKRYEMKKLSDEDDSFNKDSNKEICAIFDDDDILLKTETKEKNDNFRTLLDEKFSENGENLDLENSNNINIEKLSKQKKEISGISPIPSREFINDSRKTDNFKNNKKAKKVVSFEMDNLMNDSTEEMNMVIEEDNIQNNNNIINKEDSKDEINNNSNKNKNSERNFSFQKGKKE